MFNETKYAGYKITVEQESDNEHSNWIAIITDADHFDIDETLDFPTPEEAIESAKRKIDIL